MSTDAQEPDDDLAVMVWELETAPTSIQTEEDANRVGQRMMKLETAIAAEQRQLEIITENIEKRKKEHQRKLDWLHRQYDQDLEIWARKQRAGQKAKFVTLPYLKISWRATPPSTKIKHMDKAVEWLRANGYDHKIVVEESTTPDYVVEAIITAKHAHLPPEEIAILEHCLDTTPAGENITIGSGILKTPGKHSLLVAPAVPKTEPTPISEPISEVMESIHASTFNTRPSVKSDPLRSLRNPPDNEADDDDLPW